ncbi:206_t:CDS:2 [Funneliformis geosporum]|uniref:206_t:CDS:1 n=1 Tax=Funneliformis geosporum TaxID=1117311 RepID=A0A9W4X0D7_9GLOM|nr:206_t:CDS:2 [Funneliformis geosporum]
MIRKSTAKQKNSDSKFIPYGVSKAFKEAVSSTPAPSSSSNSTSVPTNLDLEIIQEVFSSLSEKKWSLNILTYLKLLLLTKFHQSKLLDSDKHLEDNDMEKDLKDFTVVTKATPFAVASHIKFTSKEKNNSKIILAINNVFAQKDDFREVSIRHVNLTYRHFL